MPSRIIEKKKEKHILYSNLINIFRQVKKDENQIANCKETKT